MHAHNAWRARALQRPHQSAAARYPLPASPIGFIHAGSKGGPPGQLDSSRKRSMPQGHKAQHRARLSAPDSSKTHQADCRSRDQPIPILEDRKIDWLDCLAWRTAFPLERIRSNSAAANIRSGQWIDPIGGHLKFQTIWNSGADGGDAGRHFVNPCRCNLLQ